MRVDFKVVWDLWVCPEHWDYQGQLGHLEVREILGLPVLLGGQDSLDHKDLPASLETVV